MCFCFFVRVFVSVFVDVKSCAEESVAQVSSGEVTSSQRKFEKTEKQKSDIKVPCQFFFHQGIYIDIHPPCPSIVLKPISNCVSYRETI